MALLGNQGGVVALCVRDTGPTLFFCSIFALFTLFYGHKLHAVTLVSCSCFRPQKRKEEKM
jgi:hypothetical protein